MKSLEQIQRDNRTMFVECKRCNGRGRHELMPAYAIALAEITPEWQTCEAIRRRLGVRQVSTTALANRLVGLLEFGFVERRPSPTNFRRQEWRLDRKNGGRIP